MLATIGNGWLSAQVLLPQNGNSNYGTNVSTFGDTSIVTAMFDRKAYLFRDLDTATGTIFESTTLVPSATSGNRFGFSVSLFDNVAVVGSYQDDPNGNRSGSAFLYRNLDTATGTITESAKLITSDGSDFDGLAESLALSGNIGIFGSSNSAYVFRDLDTASGIITESAKLLISNGSRFVDSVSISGNIGIVGAFGAPNSADEVYVFRGLDTATGAITESAILKPTDGELLEEFGIAVDVSDSLGLVGARMGGFGAAGVVYVFRGLDVANGIVNESAKLNCLVSAH